MNNKSTSHLCFNSFLHPSHSLFTFKLFFILLCSLFLSMSFQLSFKHSCLSFLCLRDIFHSRCLSHTILNFSLPLTLCFLSISLLLFLSHSLSLSHSFTLTLSLTLFISNCLSYSFSFQQYLSFSFWLTFAFWLAYSLAHSNSFNFQADIDINSVSSATSFFLFACPHFHPHFCPSCLTAGWRSILRIFFFNFFFESIFFSFWPHFVSWQFLFFRRENRKWQNPKKSFVQPRFDSSRDVFHRKLFPINAEAGMRQKYWTRDKKNGLKNEKLFIIFVSNDTLFVF